MKLSLTPEAARELVDSVAHYSSVGSSALGAAFLAEFRHATDLILEYPESGAPWRGRARRLPMRRFPYILVYAVVSNEVRVIALAHQRRRPGYWSGRK